MTIDDSVFGSSSEGQILKFTLALYELSHPGMDVLKVVPEALRCDKGTFIQHREGKGSIGAEGWEILGANGFDLRAYDIWLAAKRKTYRLRK